MIIDNMPIAGEETIVTSGRRVRRVGIAGAGWVSQYHLPAWRKQAERVEVVAIADPNKTAAAARQAEFGIAHVFDSAQEMLEREELDILDVCTPCEMHAPLVRRAAKRDLAAILCQKPLAPTLGEAAALIEELSPATRLMVHDNWRFRGTYRRIKEWLDAGVAGDIRRAQLEYLSSGMIPDASGQRPALVRQPNFRTLPRLLVMEVMIHHLDTLRFLFGELELEGAALQRSNDEIIGEDIATLRLVAGNGLTPVLVAGNLAAHGEPPQARDQLRVYGARATIVLDAYRLSSVGEVTRSEDFDPAATYQGAYDSAVAHFLDSLDSGTPFETGPADNLKTLALVDAAYAMAHIHGGS
jgi:predicted dehydrogenase